MRIMWQARWIPKNINRSGKSIPDSMIACGQHCREQKQKEEVEQQIREYLNMTSNLEAHLDDFGFDAQLVKSLVQRIEVSADKRIRIVFGFQDVLADFGKESAEKSLQRISAFQGRTVIWVRMEKIRATASKTRKN